MKKKSRTLSNTLAEEVKLEFTYVNSNRDIYNGDRETLDIRNSVRGRKKVEAAIQEELEVTLDKRLCKFKKT